MLSFPFENYWFHLLKIGIVKQQIWWSKQCLKNCQSFQHQRENYSLHSGYLAIRLRAIHVKPITKSAPHLRRYAMHLKGVKHPAGIMCKKSTTI